MSQFYYQQYARQAGVSPSNRPLATMIVNPQLLRAYSVLWLRPGAPLPVVKAAYRALAAHHHPDKGGDACAMLGINQAYETLERHLSD